MNLSAPAGDYRIRTDSNEGPFAVPKATRTVIDEYLVLLVREGDRGAGERLARRWHPRLLRTARRVLGDDDLARDAVQEAWLGICRGLPRLDAPERFPAFAHRILARRCADALRGVIRHRERRAPDLGAIDRLASPATAPDHVALEQAFARLSAEHRFAATLFFIEGLSLREIAEALTIPVGTVKSRLHHARISLRAALTKEEHHDHQ